MCEKRAAEFKKNKKLEVILQEVNALLNEAERHIISQYKKPKYPVMFVAGGPRTGTTLVMQWLASLGIFSYPSNLLSRFYAAPYIGAKIQLLLTDAEYAFRDELKDLCKQISYESNLGKTSGVLSPNEFWYFWRRFIPNSTPRYLTQVEETEVKADLLSAEIAAIEAVFQKPFTAKVLILLLNLKILAKIFENAFFLIVKRHPFYTIQSMLEARQKFFGTKEKWYSIKPTQYDKLKRLDPIRQVSGQVFYVNQSIRNEQRSIDKSKYLEIEYEKFCANPETFLSKIMKKYKEFGYNAHSEYIGPKSFKSNNNLRIKNYQVNRIISAYREFSGQTLKI